MFPLSDSVAHDDPLQILEVRAAERGRPVTITAAPGTRAIHSIYTVLSEELDRDAQAPSENAEDVLALREEGALIERLQPLAAADAHAVVFIHAGGARNLPT